MKIFVNNRKGEIKKELKWCTKLVVQLTYHINTTMLFHYVLPHTKTNIHVWIRSFCRGVEILNTKKKSKEKILLKVNKGWLVERKCKDEILTDRGR